MESHRSSARARLGRRHWTLLCAALAAVAMARETPGQQPAPRSAPITPAATVGEDVISLEEVARAQRVRIEQERYRLLRQKLDELIDEHLLAQEARKRGLTVDRLLDVEVYAVAANVTEEEIDRFIAARQTPASRAADPAELRAKSRDFLRSQKLAQQQQAFLRRLRDAARVVVHLEEPAGARAEVASRREFARGPASAPVTIVEFSDFQCPFCKATVPTMTELLAKYPGKVRWEFRDFPIASLHPHAAKAHEAARCAGEQGRFWDYHDVLFGRLPKHSRSELEQYARELRLERRTFASCLDGGRHAAAVARDLQEGKRLGVQVTPTYFVNGRMREGEQPLAALQELVDSELRARPKP